MRKLMCILGCLALCLFFNINLANADIECEVTEVSDSASDTTGDCQSAASINGSNGLSTAYCISMLWSDSTGSSATGSGDIDCSWEAVPPLYCPCPSNKKNKVKGSGTATAESESDCGIAMSSASSDGSAQCTANGGSASKSLNTSCTNTQFNSLGPQSDTFNQSWTHSSGCTASCSVSGTVSSNADIGVLTAMSTADSESSALCNIQYYYD